MQNLLYRIQYYNDQAAFQEFYQQYAFRLFQFAYAWVKQKEPAEEVTNDVFLKVWEKRGGLDTIGNMNVYLYVAVKNASLNYIRSKKGLRQIDISELEASHFNLSPDPEHLFITKELQKMIEQAINGLPPKCKLIFKLIREDGLSYKEVASILNISVKTVDTQLTIALKKLRLLLTLSREAQPSPSLTANGE